MRINSSLKNLTRGKPFWLFSVASIAIVVLAYVMLNHYPYRPREVIDLAQNFVRLLSMGKLNEAYALTIQQSLVGKDFSTFEEKVRRQFPVDASQISMTTMGPSQSYGNRLRRLISGRELDPHQQWVDFTFEHMGGFLVRTIRDRKTGQLFIDYFESHDN